MINVRKYVLGRSFQGIIITMEEREWRERKNWNLEIREMIMFVMLK